MTTKTKQQTTKMCGTCGHKYDVKYNTPDGMKSQSYCRHKPHGSDLGFDPVQLNGLCSNYKRRHDERKD